MTESQPLQRLPENRKYIVIIFLLFNALTSYYMLTSIIVALQDSIELTNLESIVIWAVFCLATVGFSFAGAFLAERFQRLRILYFWAIFGVFAFLTLILLENVTLGGITVFSFLSGASFGFGMPSCLALFADTFAIEKRGGMSGITFLMTNLFALPIIVLIDSFNLSTNSLIFATWRILSLIAIFMLRPKKVEPIPEGQPSFFYVLQNRSFILYVIPWILFCLVNRLVNPIVQPFLERGLSGVPLAIQPFVGSLFALVGGLLADRIGRKRIVVYGFVSLGIAYAIIGVAPEMSLACLFFVLVNSISAGLLWVIFILTIWGDLSTRGGTEKYYAMGNMPFFVSWGILQLISTQYLMLIPAYAVFSFSSFFLFLAVLPLIYAPETLPEKKMRERELKQYVEKAKKIKKKYN
jgi:MFS family permease